MDHHVIITDIRLIGSENLMESYHLYEKKDVANVTNCLSLIQIFRSKTEQITGQCVDYNECI